MTKSNSFCLLANAAACAVPLHPYNPRDINIDADVDIDAVKVGAFSRLGGRGVLDRQGHVSARQGSRPRDAA